MRLDEEQVDRIVTVGRQVQYLIETVYTGETSNEQLASAIRRLEARGDEFKQADPLVIYVLQALAVGVDAMGCEFDGLREELQTALDLKDAFRKLLHKEKSHREQLQQILIGRRTLCG